MYEIILYDTEDGRCPVQELLDSLEPKLLAKTLRTIDLLEMNGALLREPYSNHWRMGYLSFVPSRIRYYKSVIFLYCRREGSADKWIYKNRKRHQKQKRNWQRNIKQIMNGGMAMSSYKDYKKEHCRIRR